MTPPTHNTARPQPSEPAAQATGCMSEPRAGARGQAAQRPTSRGLQPARLNVGPLAGARGSEAAFTLIELLVSMAVLIGLLAMIAMIFSSATKASGQAQASASLYRVVEQIGNSIRQDLEAMAPEQSVLGIARVDVLAYASPEDAQSGRTPVKDPTLPNNDYHRADMLMLVTKRKFNPYVFKAQTGDDFEEYRLVVYGHANVDKLVPGTTPNSWVWQGGATPLRPIEPANITDPSVLSASQWHLTRRIVGSPTHALIDNATRTPTTFSNSNNYSGWPLANREYGVPLDRFSGEDPDPTHYADVFAEPQIAPIPHLTLSTLLDPNQYGIAPGTAAYGNTGLLQFYYHRDPSNSIYRNESGAMFCLAPDPAEPPPNNVRLFWWALGNDNLWHRNVNGVDHPLTPGVNGPQILTLFNRTPIDSSMTNPGGLTDAQWLPRNWLQWFYVPGIQGASRTRLDPNPPAGMADRMASYFLPGCIDFKVEFTYDDPREIAVDPATGDPILTGYVPTPQPTLWQSLPFQGSSSGNPVQVVVWNHLAVESTDYRNSTDPHGLDLRDLTVPVKGEDPTKPYENATRHYKWPRAIRITIRAVDPAGRLDPITHTIVHTWQ